MSAPNSQDIRLSRGEVQREWLIEMNKSSGAQSRLLVECAAGSSVVLGTVDGIASLITGFENLPR